MTAWVWKAGALEHHETPWNAKGNARTVTASPGSGQVNGSRTSNAPATLHNGSVTVTSRSVTPGLGSVQALPWSGLVTEDSLRAHGSGGPIHPAACRQPRPASQILSIANSQNAWNTAALTRARACARRVDKERIARNVHGSFNAGGLWTPETDVHSKAGRSLNFPHPQFTGRPWLMTSGGAQNAWRALIFLDRPLNCLFINVQKKGDSGAQKTQPKPIHNPLGFHGSSHG